jgi:hypothetical protein
MLCCTAPVEIFFFQQNEKPFKNSKGDFLPANSSVGLAAAYHY